MCIRDRVNTVLAGFIAFSIADKPAIGAGLIGGALASNTKAGFLGAVIAAFIAGYIVKWGKEHIKLPDSMQQMMPLVILPFLATGAVAIIMGVILATPLASINDALVSWLRAVSYTHLDVYKRQLSHMSPHIINIFE